MLKYRNSMLVNDPLLIKGNPVPIQEALFNHVSQENMDDPIDDIIFKAAEYIDELESIIDSMKGVK